MRANLVGSTVTIFDPRISQAFRSRTGNYWFDPANFSRAGLDATCLACVTNPSLRTYGSLPRNLFRSPGRFNVNFAIAKDTPLVGERLRLGFRAEFFNLINKAQFDNPNTNIASSLFGQITTTGDPRIVQLALKLAF